MQQQQIDRVVELMTRMADGDTAAAFELYAEFGPVIRRVMRSHLGELNATVSADDLEGLTLDAVMALLDAAPSWRPDGGAMPWTWAERRLRALCIRHVGQWTDELDERHHDRPAQPPAYDVERDDMDSLARVAGDDHLARLLVEALDRVCSRRDAQIFIGVKAQRAAGDPSPANTIAAERGMQPPAVRQVAHRVRLALVELAETDEQFTPLAQLPLLAP